MNDKKDIYTLEFEAAEHELTELVATLERGYYVTADDIRVKSALANEISKAICALSTPPSRVTIRKKESLPEPTLASMRRSKPR